MATDRTVEIHSVISIRIKEIAKNLLDIFSEYQERPQSNFQSNDYERILNRSIGSASSTDV